MLDWVKIDVKEGWRGIGGQANLVVAHGHHGSIGGVHWKERWEKGLSGPTWQMTKVVIGSSAERVCIW